MSKPSHNTLRALLLSTLIGTCSPGLADDRPNIVLIVADDMGYSDLGAYGGEIRTPNLDALAREGLQLTNYHTGATCGPTRAMLMTGVDHHRAGIGTNAVTLLRMPELREREGYEGFLNNRVVTFTKLLQDSGYHTFMTGKWDLGGKPGMLPTDRGFDRFFGIPGGGASHFSDAIGTFRPTADAAYFEDDQRIERLPDDFYTSKTYTDRLLDFIGERPDDGEPYFAYLAYTAPHWPLQVPDDWIDKYDGRYDDGWHATRQQRFDRQVELGLLPESAGLPAQNRAVADWDKLLPAQRQVELKRMELYAAMVELLDHHVGRFVEEIAKDDDRETIVLFVSDNGSEGNDIGALLDNKYWIPATFDNRLDNMGRRGSYVWLGAGWGQATVSPFRLYKSYMSEGGIRAPAVVYSTQDRFGSGRKDALMSVMDIAPTILELAEVQHPGTGYDGRQLIEMNGVSALPYLSAATSTIHGESPIGWELYGNRALIMGHWKAVLIWPPEGNGEWQLFDIESDPTETRDLGASNPEKLAELIEHWGAYAEQNGVAIFDSDTGYGRYR